MIICSNCGAELPDGTKFCVICGTAVPTEAQAETPAEVSENSENVEIVADEITEAPEITAAETEEKDKPGNADKAEEAKRRSTKKLDKRLLKVIGIAAAAALLLALTIVLFAGKGGKSTDFDLIDAAFYIKDGEIMFSELNKKDSFQVSSKLCSDLEDDEYADYWTDIANCCAVAKDGKTIFYPDKMDEDQIDDSYTLYMRTLGSKKDAVKIASEVEEYRVSADGTQLLYCSDDALFLYDVKKQEKTKITDEFSSVDFSADLDVILYEDNDGKLNYWTKKDGKTKVDSDVYQYYIGESGSSVVYLKDDTLYTWTAKDGKNKLSKDVARILTFNTDSGHFYYTVNDDSLVSFSELMKNDAKNDSSYASFWDICEDDVSYQLYSLYFYNGKESELLTDSYLPYSRYIGDYSYGVTTLNSAATALTFTEFSADDVDQGSFKKYAEADDDTILEDAILSGLCFRAAVDGKVYEIDTEEFYRPLITKDGKKLYYFAGIDAKDNEASLYCADLSGSKPVSPKLADEDVYSAYLTMVSDAGSIGYFKDVKDFSGGFYVDDKLVSDDVVILNYKADENGDIALLNDYNSKKDTAALSVWDGKKINELTDDYNQYLTLPNAVLYLADYNDKKGVGDLYYWKNGKSVLLDEDVACILPVYAAG